MTASPSPPTECSTCGRPISDHERHVRFRLPDPVIDLPNREETVGTWMSHGDANSSVMMQVPGVGPFCRCLLPVQLDGGYTLHFGVWIAIHPDELRRAFAIWWTPHYERLQLEGILANSLPGWGGLGSPVSATVQNPDDTPYITGSSDAELTRVLRNRWPHEDVLSRLPT